MEVQWSSYKTSCKLLNLCCEPESQDKAITAYFKVLLKSTWKFYLEALLTHLFAQ